MTSYDTVVSVCAENGLSVMDVDRILVSQETHDEWRESMPSTGEESLLENASDYETISGPAVRVTEGDERIIHVNEQGIEESYEL